MKVRFLIGGDSPETGPFTAGEERELPDNVGEIFVKRALAEKIDDVPPLKAAAKKEASNGD